METKVPKPKAAKSKGRPFAFSQELADAVCVRLADGLTLREVCRDHAMPSEAAVRKWALEREEFGAQYARAREIGYQAMADELLEISDDATNDWVERQNKDGSSYTEVNHDHIARSRLRVDTRKWLLSKALPKIYGDKTLVSGDIDNPVVHSVTFEVVRAKNPDS